MKVMILPRLALLLATLIAAGTFLIAKETRNHFSTLQLSWCRILLSFAIVWPVYRFSRCHGQRPAASDMWRLAILGALGVTINQTLFLHGIHFAPVLDGALLYAFTPAMVLIAAVWWLGERLTRWKAVGVLVALAGVVCVLRSRGLALSTEHLKGDLYILCAVMSWTGYTLLGKSLLRTYDTLTVITWSFGFGALSLLPFTPWALADLDWTAPGWAGWTGVVYLSGVTSGVAFTLWQWALKRLEAGQVAIFTNLQPFLTALLAWMFLDEVPGLAVAAGGLFILTGVTLAQFPGRSQESSIDADLDEDSVPAS